jgi:hypothetical protein
VKAISTLGAYAILCDMLGKKAEGTSYRGLAQQFVNKG